MKRACIRNLIPVLCTAPAAAVGCAAMSLQGFSAVTSMQNLIVLLVCGIVSFLYLRGRKRMKPMVLYIFQAISLLMLCAVFLFPGVGAVHRWIYVGPLAIQAAFIALPVQLAGLRTLAVENRHYTAAALCILISVLLFLQKDASMLTAFALAVFPLMKSYRAASPVRWCVLGLLSALALVSWIRHALLAPEAHVEGILGLAMECSPGLGVMGILSVAMLFVPFLIGFRKNTHLSYSMSCALFYAGWLLSCLSGAFPIPVMGYGASAVAGYMISATSATAYAKNTECA